MSVNQQLRKKTDAGQNIKVFVRVRPMNAIEKASKTFTCIQCQGNKELFIQERPLDKFSKKFSFDRVFPENSKQEDVYKIVAKPLVEEVLNGFNCTIFAYGQTGTGKTFTMEGEPGGNLNMNEENSMAGIVPRCVNYLFDELRIQQIEFTMRVSFLELYNEELFDLLSAHNDLTKLRLYEDATRKGSCIIQGLEEVLVKSKMDVYSIIKKGSAKRQTAATLMNATSSRSHTVFTVTVHIKETRSDGNEMLKTGKLHLVDLAGSENIGRSGAVDKRAREAGNINQSLLTIGRVIMSLVEKAPHIPYRESKLTRLLQDALGGRTKTSIIGTVSPASINLEETLSTLDYAFRAKNIKNRPEANQKLNKKELITEYSAEIDRLQRDLLATRERNGVYLANENYQDMIWTIEEQSKELLDKINYIRVIEEEREKLKETFDDLSGQLEETSSKLVEMQANLVETKGTLVCTQKLLTITDRQREEESHLKMAHKMTESKLQQCGKRLISVADITTIDINKLHSKIDRKSKVEVENRQSGDNFAIFLKDKTDSIRNNLQDVLHMQKTSINKNISILGSILMESGKNLNGMMDGFENLSAFVSTSLRELIDVLLNNEETHKMDLKNYFNEMNNDVSAIEKDCDQIYVTKVMPFISLVKFSLESFSNIISNLNEENAKKLTEIENCCHLASEEQLSNLNLLESRCKSLMDAFRNNNNFQKEQVKLLKQEHDPHIKAMDEIILAISAEKERQLMLYHNYSEMESMQKNVEEETEVKYRQIYETSTKMGLDVPRHQAQVTSLVTDIYQLQDEAASEQCNESNTLKSAQTEICVEVQAQNEKRVEQFLEMSNIASNFRSQLCSDMSTCTAELLKTTEGLNLELKENFSEKQLTLSAQEKSRADEISTVCNSVSETLIDVSDVHSQQDRLLQDCSHQVMHFFNKEIKKDIPTGDTPVRKTYEYSRNLPETSPHENILSRFRAANYTPTSPIPDTELDDDSLPNSTSSVMRSSMESCNEDFAYSQKPEFRRSGSFKEPPTFTKINITNSQNEVKATTLSKSSSVSCIEEFKENQFQQTKRRLRIPSEVKSYNSSKLRPRKILGPLN